MALGLSIWQIFLSTGGPALGQQVKIYKSHGLIAPSIDSIRYHGTELWAAMPDICKTADTLENFKAGG